MPLPLSLGYVIFDAVVRYHCFVNVLLPQIKPYNIYVTLAYPPDTDTPGLAEENKTKVHTCLTQYIATLYFQFPRYPKHAPALFSPLLASRDQINL